MLINPVLYKARILGIIEVICIVSAGVFFNPQIVMFTTSLQYYTVNVKLKKKAEKGGKELLRNDTCLLLSLQ